MTILLVAFDLGCFLLAHCDSICLQNICMNFLVVTIKSVTNLSASWVCIFKPNVSNGDMIYRQPVQLHTSLYDHKESQLIVTAI